MIYGANYDGVVCINIGGSGIWWDGGEMVDAEWMEDAELVGQLCSGRNG